MMPRKSSGKKKKMTLDEELEAAIAAELALQNGPPRSKSSKTSSSSSSSKRSSSGATSSSSSKRPPKAAEPMGLPPRREKKKSALPWENDGSAASKPSSRSSKAPKSSSSSSSAKVASSSSSSASSSSSSSSSKKRATVPQKAPPPPPAATGAPPPGDDRLARIQDDYADLDAYDDDFEDDFEDFDEEDEDNEEKEGGEGGRQAEVDVDKATAQHQQQQRQQQPPQPKATPAPAEPEDAYAEDAYADDGFEEYNDDFDDFEDEEEEEDEDQAGEERGGDVVDPYAEPGEQDENDVAAEAAMLMRRSESSQMLNRKSNSRSSARGAVAEDVKELPQQRRMVIAASSGSTRRPEEELLWRQGLKRRAQRWNDLKSLVSLDHFGAEVLEIAPQTEYEMYIKNFGRSQTAQVAVQCGEDNLATECQTEDIDTAEAQVQFPDDLGFAGAGRGGQRDTDITAFVRSVAPVFEAFLLENLIDTGAARSSTRSRPTEFSDSHVSLSCPKEFGERRVTCAIVARDVPYTVVAAYGPREDEPPAEASAFHRSPGLVLVWRPARPLLPHAVLVTEATVTCLALAPGGAHIIVAGTGEGTVQVWDAREDADHFTSDLVGDTLQPMRRPTYSTDGMYADNHPDGVVGIVGIGDTGSDEQRGAMSFQVATLSTGGSLRLWNLIESSQADEAGASTDLGLAVGGRIKAVRAFASKVKGMTRGFGDGWMGDGGATSIATHPALPGLLLVAAEGGRLCQYDRYGSPVAPRVFAPRDPCFSVSTTAVAYAHPDGAHSAAGYADGTICIFSGRSSATAKSGGADTSPSSRPQREWQGCLDGPVLSLCWSDTRPGVLFALDCMRLHVFDVAHSDDEPVLSTEVSGAETLDVAAGQVVLGYPDGTVAVHEMARRFREPIPNEAAAVADLLREPQNTLAF